MVVLLHPDAPLDLARFSVHWSTVAGLAGLAALYRWRMRHRPAGARGGSPLAFYSALALLFLSLNGPLHDLSDSYLFSAHMVQHLLLTMVIVPLLILGTPGWMLRPAVDSRGVSRAARALTRPGMAYALFNVGMIAWHLPPLYNLAMANHDVHVVQHLVFLATATLVWWPLLSPLPELPPLSHALRMLYVVLLMIPMNIIGLMITYADEVLYPAYEMAPRITALSPMEDQLVGGLIMWIPGTFILIGVATALFFRWVKVEEARG
ncbi:MAG: cytochrome c oxidase assembly protein [Gemmatimonadaceae bacterium]